MSRGTRLNSRIGALDAAAQFAPLGGSATTAGYAQLARRPESLIAGGPTFDANGAMTSAPVVWPDGTAGTYTALAINSRFLSSVDSWQITYGSTVIYTQPAVTRNAIGVVTSMPAISTAGAGDITTGLKLRYVFDGLGLANGAQVTNVPVASGASGTNALNNVNATTSRQPTITLGAQNGHDALTFSRAAQQYIRTALFAAGDVIPQPATLAVVVKRATTAVAGNLLTGGSNASSVVQHMTLNAETASAEATISALNSGSTLTSSVAPDTGWHIITGVWDGASSRLHVDGTVNTGTQTNDANGVLPRLTVGANTAVTANFADAMMLEIRAYTRALTTTDVAALRASLQSRYGL